MITKPPQAHQENKIVSMQIVALIFMVASFSLLFFWVYKPSNRKRFESLGRSIMEDDNPSSKKSEGGQS